MMKVLQTSLLVVATAQAAAAAGNKRFAMGGFNDALGTAVSSARDMEAKVLVDLDQFFEPQGMDVNVKQEPVEQVGDGFEAMHTVDCGDHGCAQPVSLLTITSGQSSRSETTDHTTSLTRSPTNDGALWTLQQAGNSCSLSWFNASWPLASAYEVQPQVYGVESCINTPGSVWFGLFQFEDSSAVDVLFEKVCGGEIDLRWTLLGDHVERIAPSKALNASGSSHPELVSSHLEFGPTQTSSATVAARKVLKSSGTVFMIVRNGCSGPTTIEVRQSLMARVKLSLPKTFDVLDAVVICLVIGAASLLVHLAMLLCSALQTLDDRDLPDEDKMLAKVSSLPSNVTIERTSSTDESEPLLKAQQ